MFGHSLKNLGRELIFISRNSKFCAIINKLLIIFSRQRTFYIGCHYREEGKKFHNTSKPIIRFLNENYRVQFNASPEKSKGIIRRNCWP